MGALDSYVSELDAALRGPRHAKRDLVREAHDHLVDATEAYEADGALRAEAELRAVREFGSVRTVVPQYQAILSAGQSRRIGMWMLAAVIAQPFAWDIWASLPDGQTVDRTGWLFHRLDDYVELIGIAAMAFAVLTVVGCGIGARYLGVRDWVLRLALTSVIVSSSLIVVMSAAMLVIGGEPTLVGAAYTATVAWAPMSLLALAGIDALRGLDSARRAAA
ncbi:permease prefix domain 1-containing protein [Solicola gregarius]|uniref:Permease prefix domain 1-containing protein n=1 Tax=Solicola gregarius TaxID=2908642 RepID=A0AA46TFP8_9ACTN|nr:permease prefix domain 1-containing protein [Solicola gregarius]UYM04492.1 permease prefix domain 1-containing protein [Solicola gregarius]